MEREVKIGEITVKFRSSAALPHLYRRYFGRDIFVDMNNLQKKARKKKDGSSVLDIDSLEMFENLAWAFAKHADPTIPEDIEAWLEQFQTFDIYNILPVLIEIWNEENISISTLKKKNGK